jgi:capsular polysaccharide transport system permease protein
MKVETTEQKFQQLKADISTTEFDSIEYLMAKAEQIEATDSALAKRILMRVNNLKKQQNVKTENRTNDTELEEKTSLWVFPKFKNKYALWLIKNPFVVFVLIPTILFICYQCFLATERYESQAQVIVQQPDGMATMDASMAILSGLGVSNQGSSDTELVKAYILSNDMLNYLDKTLELKKHYSQHSIDIFSRLDINDSQEDFLTYYQSHIEVYIDSNSNILHVYSQGFNSDFTQKLTQAIVNRAEWYINSISHQLAQAQLAFIQGENKNIEINLENAQRKLLLFQQQYNLLDPTAEGIAMQQITYGLEGIISTKEAELKGLQSIMSETAPQIVMANNELTALKEQLQKERAKLSADNDRNIPVSEILASYTDLKIKMELALQAYTSSQISLEKSRIEAYRQIKYLVVVESATLPHDAKYPEVFYNIGLFFIIAVMLFAISRIIILTVRELK